MAQCRFAALMRLSRRRDYQAIEKKFETAHIALLEPLHVRKHRPAWVDARMLTTPSPGELGYHLEVTGSWTTWPPSKAPAPGICLLARINKPCRVPERTRAAPLGQGSMLEIDWYVSVVGVCIEPVCLENFVPSQICPHSHPGHARDPSTPTFRGDFRRLWD